MGLHALIEVLAWRCPVVSVCSLLCHPSRDISGSKTDWRTYQFVLYLRNYVVVPAYGSRTKDVVITVACGRVADSQLYRVWCDRKSLQKQSPLHETHPTPKPTPCRSPCGTGLPRPWAYPYDRAIHSIPTTTVIHQSSRYRICSQFSCETTGELTSLDQASICRVNIEQGQTANGG